MAKMLIMLLGQQHRLGKLSLVIVLLDIMETLKDSAIWLRDLVLGQPQPILACQFFALRKFWHLLIGLKPLLELM